MFVHNYVTKITLQGDTQKSNKKEDCKIILLAFQNSSVTKIATILLNSYLPSSESSIFTKAATTAKM